MPWWRSEAVRISTADGAGWMPRPPGNKSQSPKHRSRHKSSERSTERCWPADDRAAIASLTRQHGRRITSAEAYLWPVLDRPNLTIRSDSPVDTITTVDRSATGVVLRDGTRIDADQVLMAAGAIHTPAILIRSGVTAPGLGEGLQDHPAGVLTLKLRADVTQDPTQLPIGTHLHIDEADNCIQMLPMSHLGPEPQAAGLGALLIALMTPRGTAGTITIDDGGEPMVRVPPAARRTRPACIDPWHSARSRASRPARFPRSGRGSLCR